MIDLSRRPTQSMQAVLQHVCVAVDDLNLAADFSHQVLGLPTLHVSTDRLHTRLDSMAWRLGWVDSASSASVGIGLPDDEALDQVIHRLQEAGREVFELAPPVCGSWCVSRAAVAMSPSGQRVDLVVGAQTVATRFRPAIDTGVCGLGPVGLRCADLACDLEFWVDCLGAVVSDRVGEIAYLRFGSRHHDIALYPSTQTGILYATLEVIDFDALMTDWYRLSEAGVAVHHGPGRESASGQRFVRFAGFGDSLLAFGWGMDAGCDVPVRPRQFALDAHSLCTWGSRCTSVVELDPGAVIPGADSRPRLSSIGRKAVSDSFKKVSA
jgi:2,3-dihydroxy-p-cumate/2,3-dihydroxybenzoate 3,4-dioxygenase